MKNLIATLCCCSAFAMTATAQETARKFRFDADQPFTLLQITDIQDGPNLKPRVAALIDAAIVETRPDLILLTGDNIGSCNEKGVFEKAVTAFIDIFVKHRIPFAVTFGNHDSEREGENNYTREEQYALYRQFGGEFFVDHDIPRLSGTGNGVIPLHAAASDEVLFNIFLMDSGAYARGGGYDGVKSDQIAWYEEVSGSIPCLWFQHIIVPDIADHGILREVPGETAGSVKYAGKHYLLNTERATGLLMEPPCPPRRAVYESEAYTFEGRTLYQSWVKMGNLKGAYFGHDHKNTLDGTDENGIRLGFCKAATLASYNDDNPGCRVFKISPDGTFSTRTITEADLKLKK